MKRLRVGPWLVAAALAHACSAPSDAFPPELDPPPVARFAPSTDDYFGPLEPAVRRLLEFEEQPTAGGHFCAVGYRYADGNRAVWVHWREPARLLLWAGNLDPDLRERGLVYAKRDLALGKDTVETHDALEGSSYRVTRAWWQAVANDCDTNGERLELSASPPTDKTTSN